MVRKKAIEQTGAWPQASFVLLCPTWTQPHSEPPSQDSRLNVTKHSSQPRVEEEKGGVQSGARGGSFRARSLPRGPCSCSQDAVSSSPPRLALPSVRPILGRLPPRSVVAAGSSHSLQPQWWSWAGISLDLPLWPENAMPRLSRMGSHAHSQTQEQLFLGKHGPRARGLGHGPRVRRPTRHCSSVSVPTLSGGGCEEGPHRGGCRMSEALPAAKPRTPSKGAVKLCGCPKPSQRPPWGQVGSRVAAEELGLRLVPSLWLPPFTALHLARDWKLSLCHLVMSWGLDTRPPGALSPGQ